MSIRTKIALIVSFFLWVLILAFTVVSAGVGINHPPTAQFSYLPVNLMIGTTVVFSATGSFDPDIGGYITSYAWNFGDDTPEVSGGLTKISTQHTYTTAGIYPVTLSVTDNDGAIGTKSQNITVVSPANQVPVAQFSYTPASPMVGIPVIFSAIGSSDPDGLINSYTWNSGDGTTGSGIGFTHTYSTSWTYTVTLTVTDNDGATDTYTDLVTVEEIPINVPPIAQFNADSNTGKSPLTVMFDANQSSDTDGSIELYEWNFGDEQTASGINVSHIFTAETTTTYTVTLTVTDNEGASNIIPSQAIIVVSPPNQVPVAQFSYTPASPTVGIPVIFSAIGSSDPDGLISSYAWNSGDGVTGSGIGFTHTYSTSGTYTVILTVTDNDGAIGTKNQNIMVVSPPTNQAPTAMVNAAPGSGELPLVVTFNANGSDDLDGVINSYAWDFDGNGVTDVTGITKVSPLYTYTYTAAGNYIVKLTVTDNDGAIGTKSQNITVVSPPANQVPGAQFSYTPASPMVGIPVIFSAIGSSDPDGTISSYAWDFGDGVTASGVSATHTYSTSGPYTVTLTVTDNDGATDIYTELVTVEEVPWPMSGYNASHSGCSPHVGISDPWMIPITFDGYEEVAPGSPLLIGRGGIIFLTTGRINRPEEIIAVRADSENPETCQVLWRFPLYEHAPCPAIGFDGTVYVYDVEGTLVGLNPDNGTKDWDSGYNGKNSYLYDIQVSSDGRICTSTNERTLVYSPAPERQLLYQLEQGGYPTFAPNGTLYIAKHSGDKDKILAVDQNGLIMWEQILTKRYKSACVFLVDQENTLYRWEKQSTKDGSTPYITAITHDGSIRWERAFPDVFPLFSEPVLGPDGTLYVMTRAEPKQGEIFLQAINKADGSNRWSRGLTEILDTAGVANTVRVVSGYNSSYAHGVHSMVDANGVVYIYLSSEWNRKEDGELLLIDGNTGDLIQRIVNAGRNYILEGSSRNLAMNSDGTVYLASVDSLMATVPNEPPRIVDFRIRSGDSYYYPLRQKYEVSYSESSGKVSFCFESIIDDPLWGGRNLVLTWDFGDGTTESKDISIRTGKFPRRRSEENLQGYLTYKACHTYDHTGVYLVTATLSVDGHSETFVQDGILACGIPPTLIDITQQEKGPHILNDGTIYGGTEVELTFQAVLPGYLATLLVGDRDLRFHWNLNAPGFWVNTGSYDRGGSGVLTGDAPFEDPISITYCFANPGTYEAKLKVWEKDWPIFIERTVLVHVSAPPVTPDEEEIPPFIVVVTHTPDSILVNSAVTFQATIEPISTSGLSYSWEFFKDDKNIGSSDDTRPSYTFENGGSHKIKVTVSNNDGTATGNQKVQVYTDNAIQTNLNCLTITAENGPDPGNLEGTYTSGVRLNGFLGMDKDNDSLTVWSDDLINSEGNFVVYSGDDYKISTGGGFAIKERKLDDNNECYRPVDLSATDFIPTIPIYGFNIDLADFKLYDGTIPRLTVTGTIKPIFPWTGNFKEISFGLVYSQSGMDFLANVEDFKFNIAGFGISEGSLKLNTLMKSWEASAKLKVPIPKFPDIIALIGFLEGDLNKVGFGIDNLNIAIGGPPPVVFLQELYGELDNLASEDPIVLTAKSTLTAGPKINLMGTDYSLLGGKPNISIDMGGKLSIGGELYFLKEGFGTFGEAKLVLDIAKGLYLRGKLKYPPGDNAIIVSEAQGKVDFDGNFQGRLDGTISAPRYWWLIGGKTFSETVGYIDNDLISVGVKIGDSVCLPYFGCYNLQIKVSVTYEFDAGDFDIARNWDSIQEVTLDDEAMAFGKFYFNDLLVGVGDSFIQKLNKMVATTMLSQQPDTLTTHSFEIPEWSMPEWKTPGSPTPEELQKLPVYIFRMESTVQAPSFTLEDPDKNVYDRNSSAVLWQDHVFYKDDMIETWESWCAVPAPKPGRWTLYPQSANTKAIVQGFRINEEPSLTITSPEDDITIEVADTNSKLVHITWVAEDPDSDEVSVRLCYTEDQAWNIEGSSGIAGNTIVEGLSKKENYYDWDTTGVPPGRYRILGIITDDKNSPIFAWSEGSITVQQKDFPPPEEVSAYQDGSLVQVEWKSVPGASGYRIYYQDVKENTSLVQVDSQAVWEDTTTKLRCLKPGVTYRIAVTAFKEDGLESDYSIPIEVTIGGL
jgi:PKD repeat protein